MIQSPYPVLHSVEFFVTEIPWYRCGVDVTAVVHEVMLVVGVLWAKHTQAITLLTRLKLSLVAWCRTKQVLRMNVNLFVNKCLECNYHISL